MIYCRFHGRTGNQMFQYSAARALALHHNTEVVLDDRYAIDRGERSITRIFDLPVATSKRLPPAQHTQKLRYAFWRKFGANPKFMREHNIAFNPDFFSTPDNVYLHGYWQSEKYFAAIADIIRRDFTFPPAQGKNAELAAQIQQCNSVSLHVRRGDYLNQARHAMTGQEYYDGALEVIEKNVGGNFQIFVFSDDPNWAKNHLKLPGNPVIIEHNGEEQDYEDMRLMSLCRHNIVAYSSFSWWGAWLNQNPDRCVTVPNNWVGLGNMSNPDFWAAGWTKV